LKREYKKYFVAFMDILGYKNLVAEMEQNEINALNMISRLEEMIEKCIKDNMKSLVRHSSFGVEYKLFSDSLCIFIPADESEEGEKFEIYKNHSKRYIENNYIRLWLLCNIVANIQLDSMQYGIIFRGAISFGNHFHNENIIFSKALIDAYYAESEQAIYPRVILLHNSENDILELLPVLYEYYDLKVALDDDYLFVDYLERINDFRWLLDSDCDYIKWHKNIIQNGMKKFSNKDNLYIKYVWMMNYHNNKLVPIFGDSVFVYDFLN